LKHLKIYEDFQTPSISELDGIEGPQNVVRFLASHSSTENEAAEALKLIQSPKVRNIISSPEFMEYAGPILRKFSMYKSLEPLVNSLLQEIEIGGLEREKEVDFSPVERIYHKDSDDLKP
jgi:hypothetical protein